MPVAARALETAAAAVSATDTVSAAAPAAASASTLDRELRRIARETCDFVGLSLAGIETSGAPVTPHPPSQRAYGLRLLALKPRDTVTRQSFLRALAEAESGGVTRLLGAEAKVGVAELDDEFGALRLGDAGALALEHGSDEHR